MIGRFLTQFFLMAWGGAAIISTLLACIYLLTSRVAKQGWTEGLSMTPAIALWAFMCDENALLGAIVAIALALMADWCLSTIENRLIRLTLRIITIPVLYWALGPIAIISCILYLINAIRCRDKIEIIIAASSLVVMIMMPLLAQIYVALPLNKLYMSPHYYRDPQTIPQLIWIAVGITVVVAMLPATSPCRWKRIMTWATVICSCGWVLSKSYNRQSEEVMSYDFMCRFQQWNRLTETAQHKKPKNSLSCTALNLALGMKGQLGDHIFEYNQNGVGGLIPRFNRDAVSPLTTSEVYYQLGLINTAQRLVFEAQEAIADYQKSGRCYKRLAETNLIIGNYEVARKYIDALSKTIFYRAWAKEAMSMLDNQELINNNKEYGHLRKLMPNEDYMFQEQIIGELLGRQMLANKTNRLAYEYLLCAFLLERDLDSFASCLGMGSEINYQHMPYMFQQAYSLWWSRNHNAQEKMPDFINPNIIGNLNQFANAMQKAPTNRSKLSSQFGNTYWYYYFMH